MRVLKSESYSYDDVLLVPQYSKITSRSDVDIGTKVGRMKLKLPIFSANMDTVTEARMAMAMANAGGAGVLHRFCHLADEDLWLQDMRSAEVKPRIISIGLDRSASDVRMTNLEYDLDAVCIDVAHGDHERVVEVVETLRKELGPDIDIIAGNVATRSGARRLLEAGASVIKVGIGPGSVCSTRVVSGHGVPQLTAVSDVAEVAREHDASVIADGGIRYPGDIVKALAVGADAVMLGSVLAGTDEAAGERIVEDGHAYKTYRGMASREAQTQKRSGRTPRVEGVSARVPYRGPVIDTLHNFEAGIRSGFSYSGACSICELRDYAEFMVVTNSTIKESHPHHPYRL